MSAQNIESYNIHEKSSWCSRCIKSKTNAEFTRLYKDRLQKCALCNLLLENVNNDERNEDEFIYDVYDFEEFVACKFRDNEEKEDPVEFSAIVEIEKELINDEILSLEFENKEQNF
ncbi:6707_t:CDS:2, partial [Racocetra persica]